MVSMLTICLHLWLMSAVCLHYDTKIQPKKVCNLGSFGTVLVTFIHCVGFLMMATAKLSFASFLRHP